MDDERGERRSSRGETVGERRPWVGCGVGLVTLLVGVGLGVALTLNLLGLGPGALLGREPTAVPPVVQAVTPAPQAMQGQAAPGRRVIWGPAIPLDSDTREPDLLVVSYNYDLEPSADSLTYLSPDTGAVRWESQTFGDNGSSWVVSYGETMVVFADEATLRGLSRATGELVWEAPLTDSIAYSICEGCLQVFGDVVVALPQDGMLQAFAVETGAPRWSVRLREATRELVRVGDLLGVPDSREDDPSWGALFLYRPADGALVEQITPSCEGETGYEQGISYYMDTDVSPDGGTLAWLVSSSPLCLVSYDVASGSLSYTRLDEQFTGASASTLWAGDTLYLSDTDEIYAVGPQETRRVLGAEDYRLRPIAAEAGVLLVEAERSRGSSRYELWAVDVRSGERRWERVLVGDDPLEPSYGVADFTATLIGDAVALVEQHEEPEQIVYELIALADGASRARAVLAVEDAGDYIRGAVWGSEHVFLSIDELYGVELSSGRTALRWP